MEHHDLSRRSLLQGIAATLGIAAVPTALAEIAWASHDARAAAQAAGGSKMSFLTAPEAADVEAVAAQIIPTDDTPGAREAGVVFFIDRALATVLTQLAGDYRAQVAEFRAALRERYPGAVSFASLTAEQQLDCLRAVEHTPFFDLTRLLTLLGMFSAPAYGGNRAGAGWALIGFEDRHSFQPPFGYYDTAYPGFAIDREQMP